MIHLDMEENKNMGNYKPEFKLRIQLKYPSDTSKGRIERSVYIIRDPRGFMADKMHFLFSKGVTQSEYLTALNIASSGELLQVALSNN